MRRRRKARGPIHDEGILRLLKTGTWRPGDKRRFFSDSRDAVRDVWNQIGPRLLAEHNETETAYLTRLGLEWVANDD